MKITGMIVLILVILVAVALAEVWRELHCFKVTDYQIRTSKMEKNTGKVRIAFLSDLHNHVYGKENADLLDAIREAKPDLILAGGDMLVGKIGKDWSPAAEFMKKLPQIAPVWCCNGNHEQRMHEQPEIYGKEYWYYKKELEQAGIHFLINASEEIRVNGMKLHLYGMELPFGCYKKGRNVCPLTNGEMEERIGNTDTDAYCILLAHHPLYAETYWKWGADLALSGHLHGGIARLPLIGGVISPQFRLFPRYSGDCYEKDGKYIVVSKGLGTHTINFRFWNPAELVVLDIVPSFLYNK